MTGSHPSLQLGLVLPPCLSGDELRAVALDADDSGLHSLWVTDRTVAGMPWLDALTMLGALAGVTRRVQIGTSVLVLPRRNPVHVAHALATADYLTGGRLIAGIGVGNAAVSGPEFAIAGADMTQRGRLADEYLALVRRLWTQDDGETSLAPKPGRHVPVWIGGSTSAARRRAGRAGDGWLAVFSAPGRFAAEWAEVRHEADRHGRDPSQLVPATYLFGAIDEDGMSSRRLLDGTLPGFLGVPLDAVADTCIWGTPGQWLQRLAQWQEAGARHVNVALFTSALEHDMHLLTERVVPQLATSPVAASQQAVTR